MSEITQLKINLIEYYENLKNRIDIKTQTQLVDSTLPEEREELLQISDSFVAKCEETLKKSIEEMATSTEEPDSEELSLDQLATRRLSSHCLLIEDSILPLKNSIGLLVVSDWPMNANEILFINKLFSLGDKSILEVLDERDLIEPPGEETPIGSQSSFVLTENLLLIKHAYDCSRVNKRYRNQNNLQNKHLVDLLTLSRQSLIADLNRAKKFHLSGFEFNLIEKDAFKCFANLSELSLWGNRISALTSDLFNDNFKNLIKLELFSCSIKKIEVDAFAGLIHLEHLNLGHNPQIDLNSYSQFNGLTSLRSLNLSDNDFKLDINDLSIFKNMTNLVHLDLALSSLRKQVRKELFTGLVHLKKLDLAHCMITSIERGSFMCLSSLKELDLKFNYILNIDSTTFEGLVNLEKLDLQDCSITRINADSFHQQKMLKHLHLVQNNIECLEMSAFNGLGNLEELMLSYRLDMNINAFQCLTGLKSLVFSVDHAVLPPRNPMDIKRLFNLASDVVVEFRGVL